MAPAVARPKDIQRLNWGTWKLALELECIVGSTQTVSPLLWPPSQV